MPRQTNQQKQIHAATQQIASGLAGLFSMLIPAAPAAQTQPAKRRGRPGRIATTKPAPRKKRRLSAKTRLLFKQQGAYMGLVRRLSAAKKAELKKLRMAKGYEAAIAAARKMIANR